MSPVGALDGQVALVTGGTRGLGLGIARRLAAEGASVAVVGRDKERARAVALELSGTGAPAVGVGADVSSWEETSRAVAKARNVLGSIDIVVANAGIGIIGPVADADPADWARMMDINYLGTAHVTKAVTVTIKTSDAKSGVAKIGFSIDNHHITTVTKSSLSLTWHTAKLKKGRHLLTAKVFDRAGNVTIKTVTVVVG